MKKTRKRPSFLWRATAFVLAMALLLSSVPGGVFTFEAEAAIQETPSHGGIGTKIADAATVNDWKLFFHEDNTENAGGIWTDKSVFNSAGEFVAAVEEVTAAGDVATNLSIDADNFLVALSALASTKSVEGYSYLPTDTMLVLDLSASMVRGSNYVDDLVDAANDAIAELLSLNVYNRVGVVAYSGNNSEGDSNTSTTTVILPLDRYNADQYGNYLTDSYNGRTGVQVVRGVTDSNGNSVTSTGKSASGGTYIQNGLYQAWQQFEDVIASGDTVIQSGAMAGTVRTPVMVLMSDGEPTAATTGFNNVGTSNIGDGTSPNANENDLAFLTQLTSTWINDKMKQGYQQEPLFYTLGLNVGSDYNALAVMDPGATSYTATVSTADEWERYKALANSQGTMTLDVNGDGNNPVSLAYTAPVFDAWDNTGYVDEYFPASNESGLLTAFDNIVDHIILQSMYYPTLVEGDNVDHDGHLEFTDYIGANMEVKSIKGIQLGDTLYGGSKLAQLVVTGSAGDIDNPTEIGDNLVWSVRDRLGITAMADQTAVERTRDLLADAFESGQIAYNMSTGAFSNYVGWYGNENGTFVAFWDGGSTEGAPAEAVTANKSYLFLDAVGEGHRETDMLYASIMVSAVLKDHNNAYGVALKAGEQVVIGKLPASLIPIYHYDIGLNGTSITDPDTFVLEAATPSRLVYEVGLSSQIDLLDIAGTAPNKDALETADGKYVFYTNEWSAWDDLIEGDIQNAWKSNTTAYFEPSEENENYYFSEHTPIYDGNTDDASRVTQIASGGTYYRRYLVYTKNGNTIGTYWKYEPISSEVLADPSNYAADADGYLYVKKGVIHRYVGNYVVPKRADGIADPGGLTDTANYSDYPFVHHVDDGSHEGFHMDSLLGNNGKLTLEAYEGIRITKEADSTIENREQEYTFTITASAGSFDGTYTLIKEKDGVRTTVDAGITFTAGKATVTLTHGESAYILGTNLAGTTFTVMENPGDGYEVATIDGVEKDSAVITVLDNTITPTRFVNTKLVNGDVVISKDVISTHADHRTNLAFEFEVTLKPPTVVTLEGTYPYEKVVNTTVNGTTTTETVTGVVKVTSGVVTMEDGSNITLKHEEYLTIQDLPDGVIVTVEEIDLPAGFTSNQDLDTSVEGIDNKAFAVIAVGETQYIHYENTYAALPSEPNTNFHLSGTKTLINGDKWTGGEFSFKLQKLNTEGKYEDVYIDQQLVTVSTTVNGGATTATFTKDISNSFTTAGTHSYRIVETAENNYPGIIYDPVMCYFNIVVEDDGLGRLKVTDVVAGQDTTVELGDFDETTGSLESATINVQFTNEYAVNGAAEAIINIGKTVESKDTMASVPESGFLFNLYKTDSSWDITNATPIKSDISTDAAGNAVISLIYDEESELGTHYYVITEQPDTGNYDNGTMTYSTEEYYLVVEVTDNGTAQYAIDVTVTKKSDSGWIIEKEAGSVPTSAATPPEAPAFTILKNEGADTYTVTISGGENTVVHYFIEGQTLVEQRAEGNQVTINTFSGNGTIRAYAVANDVPSQLSKVTYVAGTGTTETVDIALPDVTVQKELGSFVTVKAEVGNVVYQINDGDEVALNVPDATFTIGEDINVNDTITVWASAYGKTSPNKRTYTLTEEGITGPTETAITATTSPSIAVVEISDIAFLNEYEPRSVQLSVPISGTKTLNGRDMAAEEFTFTLTEVDAEGNAIVDGETQTLKNAAADNGKASTFTFANITYTSSGTHYYIVKEQLPTDDAGNPVSVKNGITYDTKEFHVTVVVTGDASTGALSAQITSIKDANGNAAPIAFTNTYTLQPIDVTLAGTKTLYSTLRKLNPNAFSFELYATGPDYAIAPNATALQTVNNGAVTSEVEGATTAGFQFELDFAAAGDYYYVVKEVVPSGVSAAAPSKNGVTFDLQAYNVHVKVVDNGNGTLTATTTVNGTENGSITFTNSYSVSPTSYTISGTKELEGAYFASVYKENQKFSDLFQFELYKSNENWEEGTKLQTKAVDTQQSVKDTSVKNEAKETAKFTFDSLSFVEPGTYYYIVKEAVTTDDPLVNFDPAVYHVQLAVTDDLEGGLHVSDTITKVGVSGERENIEFSNTVLPEALTDAQLNIGGNKTYSKDATAGQFTFELYQTQVNNGVVTTDGGPVLTATHEAGAANTDMPFVFKDTESDGDLGNYLTFSNPGTYYFIIKEKLPVVNGSTVTEHEGIKYDTTEYLVTVLVEKRIVDGRETLSADVTYKVNGSTGDGSASITFNNTYGVTASDGFALTGTKTLNGRDMAAGEFTFTLTEVDKDGKVIPNGYTDTATNTAAEDGVASTFSFKEITYSEAKNYYYVIEEENAGNTVDSVQYSTSKYFVTVSVTDNGLGKLVAATSVKMTDANGEQVDTAAFVNTYSTNTASVTMGGTKVLTGRDMKAEEFTFELVQNGTVIDTAANTANGTFLFDEIKYTDDGVFEYTIREKAGNLSGIDYDEKTYTVKVTVTDDGKGTLSATTSVANKDVVFTNVYKPAGIGFTLEGGTKTLTGRDMKAGEFKFLVHDTAGTLVATGTNTADGKITFTPVNLATAGNYVLTVTEENTKADYVTYDTSKFEVKITVTDNGGVLVAEATYPEGGIAFANKYEEPKKEDSPDTGDSTNLFILAGLMAVSVIGFLCVLFLGKKKGGKYLKAK